MAAQNMLQKTSYTQQKDILFAESPRMVVSTIIANTGLSADANGKKLHAAGTPVTGSLVARTTPFVKAAVVDTAIEGVYDLTIGTAFTTGEKITIEGAEYAFGTEESVPNKVFIGADAAAQVTSLLKMVVCNYFNVAAVSGATSKIRFTQKVAEHNESPAVSKSASTGAYTLAQVTEAIEGYTRSNAIGLLLHDVDVTGGDVNTQVLVFGFVNAGKLDYTPDAYLKEALDGKITFITE
jgi:hypothetical protein